MNLNECNPFIRSLKPHTLTENTKKTYALNHRLLYFTEGKGSLYIHPTSYPVYKDTAILYPAGTIYQLFTDSEISFITLNFDYSQQFTHLKKPLELQREGEGCLTPLEEVSFTDFAALNREIYIPNAIPIINDIYTIWEERRNKKPGYRSYCSGLLKTTICKILRTSTTSSNAADPKVSQIFSYIHENYASDIDNMQIATHLSYHPYYVNKIFSAHTGMTIHQYLNHYRLIRAAHYLSTGTLPIHQISSMVGFQTPTHFAENFKKKFGVTPKEYRNMRNNS